MSLLVLKCECLVCILHIHLYLCLSVSFLSPFSHNKELFMLQCVWCVFLCVFVWERKVHSFHLISHALTLTEFLSLFSSSTKTNLKWKSVSLNTDPSEWCIQQVISYRRCITVSVYKQRDVKSSFIFLPETNLTTLSSHFNHIVEGMPFTNTKPLATLYSNLNNHIS